MMGIPVHNIITFVLHVIGVLRDEGIDLPEIWKRYIEQHGLHPATQRDLIQRLAEAGIMLPNVEIKPRMLQAAVAGQEETAELVQLAIDAGKAEQEEQRKQALAALVVAGPTTTAEDKALVEKALAEAEAAAQEAK